jgi:histone-lysine N-methyltransferase MLL3
MICVSVQDDFVLKQDICLMCGSIGTDLEGRLIACTQCGECYHPHCINVRVSKVLLFSTISNLHTRCKKLFWGKKVYT